jgi:hypothetical protein
MRFKRLVGESDTVVVVDGQQRLITTSLLLAASWHLGRRLRGQLADSPGWEDNDEWPETEAAIRRSLFLKGDIELKLTPSLTDRSAFRLAIIDEDPSLIDDASCVVSQVLAARRRFDGHLAALVESSVAAASLALVGRIVRGSLDLMRPMLVELDPKENLPAVFQQYQEQSLLGVAALLQGVPGVSFQAQDLVRNFVMADFVELELEEQEKIYEQLWLTGLEDKAPPGGLDAALDKFLSSVGFPPWPLDGNDAPSDRFVSDFETRVTNILRKKQSMAEEDLQSEEEEKSSMETDVNIDKNGITGTNDSYVNFSGIEIYARFYSYFQDLDKVCSRNTAAETKTVRSCSVYVFLEAFSKFLTQLKRVA